ncbi:MAG: ribonuclease E/G [Clostridiales bacterium]|nr:ribonuclease E/G [Clostridiales bacterium]
MDRTLLLARDNGKACAALIEGGRLVQFIQDSDGPAPGSVYLGRVQRVLEGLGGAFVDIGFAKNGLISGESDLPKDENGKIRIKQGQELPVQVIKDPGGDKGAQLSANIRLAGRYSVLLPNSLHVGVSRRIADDEKRERLKALGEKLVHGEIGLILRTQAEEASDRELAGEVEALSETWSRLSLKAKGIKAPVLLWDESGALTVAAREIRLDADTRITAQDQELLDELAARFDGALPCSSHIDGCDILTVYRVRAQLENAKKRRVDLKSGGFLVFDDTEALRVIDVNSGSFAGKDAEDTAFRLNLEAAEEIAVQTRLRNLTGIIVIDFVDMRNKTHRNDVIECLRQAFKHDTGRTDISPISALGLCEMSRYSRYSGKTGGE